MPDPLIFADLLIRGAIIALLALLIALIARDRRRSTAISFGAALALGMINYVLETSPMFEAIAPRPVQIALTAVSNGNNPLFWLFALALFDDDFRARLWQLLVWVLIVGFAAMTLLSHDEAQAMSTTGLHFWSHRILGWLPIAFVALTMAAAFKHWRNDLVERRRWLRVFIVVAGFIYMLGSAIARLETSDGRLGSQLGLIDVTALGVIVFVIAWRLLTLNVGELLDVRSGAQTDARTDVRTDPAIAARSGSITGSSTSLPENATGNLDSRTPENALEQALAQALDHLIKTDKVYREENLTINRLASRLAVPEYRLRRLINQQLGYRNFNAFLNTYRLQQVVDAMAAPASSHLPILTLALDAGFQSIGPFNRAFKQQFQMTPTEFRAKHRADSGIG